MEYSEFNNKMDEVIKTSLEIAETYRKIYAKVLRIIEKLDSPEETINVDYSITTDIYEKIKNDL